MRATGKLAVAAALAAAPAFTQSPWAETPTASELRAYYPEKTDGPRDMVANIRCAVADDGRLSQCVVASETPIGYGFGAWALALMPKFRATPEAAQKMHGSVTIPIRLSLASDPPARSAKFQSLAPYRRLGDAGPYYPERAAREGVTAVALMDCRVGEHERLEGCKVIEVTNRDYGFEFAALKMAQQGWMTAGPVPDGATPPADGYWRFKVVFDGGRR